MLEKNYARHSQSIGSPKIQQSQPAKEIPAPYALLQAPSPTQRGTSLFIEAAFQTGINYLTAKTIVFFHKKDHKSYQFDLRLTSHLPPFRKKLTASYISLKKKSPSEEKASASFSKIEVVCSTGNVPVGEGSREVEHVSYGHNDM